MRVGGVYCDREEEETRSMKRRGNGARRGLAHSEKHVKDAPSNCKSKVWAHFGFYNSYDGTVLDKDFALCKKCLAKVK